MDDTDIGIFEEAQRRREYYATQSDNIRRKILGAGPARNGAWAEAKNPFVRPTRLPPQPRPPFWLNSASRRRRRRSDPNPIETNPLAIVQAVCRLTGLAAAELLRKTRMPHISHPRQIAIYLIARHCEELSLSQIAYIFSCHHTTAMHAINIVPARVDNGCSKTRAVLEEVEAVLRQQ